MPTAILPSIILPLDYYSGSGNPLLKSVTDSTSADHLELFESDQLPLRLYLCQLALQIGTSPANLQLAPGVAIVCAGKRDDALGSNPLLFKTTVFVQGQEETVGDASGRYYYETFLDLDKNEIHAEFGATGENSLSCLVDIEISQPSQVGPPMVPASRKTYQIAVVLKRQVYSGSESEPTSTGLGPAPADGSLVATSPTGVRSWLATSALGRALLNAVDAAAARLALGLGTAATRDVGTTLGTVAAGDDPRFGAGGAVSTLSDPTNGNDPALVASDNTVVVQSGYDLTNANVTASLGDGGFTGLASGLNNLNASALASGYVPAARLPIIALAGGGTGATTASGARTALGAAASGANGDITSLTACTSVASAGLLTLAPGGTTSVSKFVRVLPATDTGGGILLTPAGGWTGTSNVVLTFGDTSLASSIIVPFSSAARWTGYYGLQAVGTAYPGVIGFNVSGTNVISFGSTVDLGFGRASAGAAEVNNGTAGVLRDLALRALTASGPIKPGSYTRATLPSVGSSAGSIVTISDPDPGKSSLLSCDGVHWLYGDGTLC